MAKSENNEVMYGARGKVGNLVVFKNFGKNQTVIAKVQKRNKKQVYTEKQEEVKNTFREAVVYARGITADPDLLAFYSGYAKPGSSAYNMALADFCRPPEIKTIDLKNYLGNVGDPIRIRAIDNFRVMRVKVLIFDLEGVLIESGLAEVSPNSVDWYYQATVSTASILQNISVSTEVTDVPGNISVKRVRVIDP